MLFRFSTNFTGHHNILVKEPLLWAVVVAQLVERSLTTPEICNSNPDIVKILSTNCTIEKAKIKKKRPGMYPDNQLKIFVAYKKHLICVKGEI